MDFIIRKAAPEDVEQIMVIMEEAKASSVHPEWFVADTEDYVREHLDGTGFVVVAESDDGNIAGFFLVKKPEPEENLGTFLDFSEQQLAQVVIMDSAAVRSEYRGNNLQSRMLKEAEGLLEKSGFCRLMCTVHPENRFSLNNMQKNGYEIQKTVRCYGGLERHILMKEI